MDDVSERGVLAEMTRLASAIAFMLLTAAPASATALSVDWKPLTMSLDACVALADRAMRGQGLDVYYSGQKTDANGTYGYAWGRNAKFIMGVDCVQRQSIVFFAIASDETVSSEDRVAVRDAVSGQF